MKRDLDLVREILLRVEEIPPFEMVDWSPADFPDRDFAAVSATVNRLMKDGFMDEIQQMIGDDVVTPGELTWSGHDLLDGIRDDKIWKETKAAASHAGGFTFDLLKEIAAGIVKTQLKKQAGVEL